MSFTDRLILWLHIGVAIFTIGPVTAAIMSTPRYIRKRDAVIVGYLHRITRVYAIASLLVFVFGLVAAEQRDDFDKPWISISMTLFVVALVLLALIIRDQRAAATALKKAAALAAPAPQPSAAVPAEAAAKPEDAESTAPDAAVGTGDVPGAPASVPSASASAPGTPGAPGSVPGAPASVPGTGTPAAISAAPAPSAPSATSASADLDADRIAAVERGRIASLGGVTALIWLVILILMVWR